MNDIKKSTKKINKLNKDLDEIVIDILVKNYFEKINDPSNFDYVLVDKYLITSQLDNEGRPRLLIFDFEKIKQNSLLMFNGKISIDEFFDRVWESTIKEEEIK